MGSTSINAESQIIEIEDDVIDLDETEKTTEEVIYEWDAQIRKKFLSFTITDNVLVLEALMKDYLQLLQEMTRSYEDNETLRSKVYCHISFLYSYYVELEWYTPDIYLNKMEDILTLYCNLELEIIRPIKRKDFVFHKYTKRILSVARRIINVLTVYLLERHDHILHVLIKMNTTKISDSCSDVLTILYTHFLTKVPAKNQSDESFCRHYIVFRKWKEIRKIDDWEEMDKTMYKMFKRTPESIKQNETLKQILMPPCTSTIDIVMNLFQSLRAISTAYFKYISSKKNVELDDIDFNIDLGDDEPTLLLDDSNDEEVQFMKTFDHFEQRMSNFSDAANNSDSVEEINIFRRCKEELDEDDDVQFIGDITPPRPLLNFAISADKQECDVNNVSNNSIESEDTEPAPSLLMPASTSKEKNPDLEILNGLSRFLVGSPRTVTETPDSCQSTEFEQPTEPTAPSICTISKVTASCDAATETNEPEVPLLTNKIPLPCPSSPEKITEPLSDSALNKRTVEMKSVEVQADNTKDYLYNGYGLTTPPFDVQNDEQIARPVEPRLYTDIGQKPDSEKTRSIEVQVDPPPTRKDCSYDDYGLTPPNDSEDHTARLQEPLYTNIGHKDLSSEKAAEKFSDFSPVSTHNSEIPQDNVAQETTEVETDNRPDLPNENERVELEFEAEESIIAHVPQHDSDYDDSEDQLDISETDPVDTEEVDVETCSQEDKNSNSDKIDTGQKAIQNSAPNIPVTADSEIEDLPAATHNGNTILKPLLSSNRTNGQAKDNTSTKIMYTSSQRIRPVPLDKFSMFESAINSQWSTMKENHDFDDILSGPVSKVVPVKQNSLLSSPDKLDPFETNSKPAVNSNSRSNSPNEMTSPAYEDIDDFRKYFSHSINGHVPSAQDRVPTGILKKTNAPKKNNRRIMFHESTFDKSEERKARSDGVLVPKRVRRDPKLNLEPRVVLERLSYIESRMKKLFTHPPTLRIDYDKTTPHINEKDVVRCLSPPRITWIISSNKLSSGSLTVKNREHLEKKPKKRKFDSQISSEQPAIRKRAFRAPPKEPLATKKRKVRKRRNSGSFENTFISKSDSEYDKLLNSGAYSNKPFRVDLT